MKTLWESNPDGSYARRPEERLVPAGYELDVIGPAYRHWRLRWVAGFIPWPERVTSLEFSLRPKTETRCVCGLTYRSHVEGWPACKGFRPEGGNNA